ncbi:6734_t:CDS:2 [Paraglomus brasilianum]|uniref:6734_t:CDS:1 n=1 Tax=Paraglomus brasilianum TaxID=144538 RepID=A0A9N8YYM7_9GLOM|nr:6734_t:CDS:2 [Paraglomus brasilianum]
MTRYDFTQAGLELGPAMRLAKEANAFKATTPKRSFSSYHSLSEELEKYGIESEGIDAIPLFNPPAYKIQDNDKHFEECITEISIRLRDYGDLNPDSLEAVRNEYVVAILHAALHIVRDDTKKKFSMRPQQKIIDEESCGCVDYAIKDSEALICITENKQHQIPLGFAQNIKQLESSVETNKRKRKRDEAFGDDFDYIYGIVTTGRDWHFLLYSPGEIARSKPACTIEFNQEALDKDSEEYQALHKSVKRVLETIVGLLKDRACVEKLPSSKRTRVEEYRSKR